MQENKDISSQFNSGALGSHFGGLGSFGNNAGNQGFGPAFAQGIGQATVRASDQAATLHGSRGPTAFKGFGQTVTQGFGQTATQGFGQTATQGFGQSFGQNIEQAASQKSDQAVFSGNAQSANQNFGVKFGHALSSENRRPLHIDLQGNVIPQSIFLNGNHEPAGTAHPAPTPLQTGRRLFPDCEGLALMKNIKINSKN